MMQEAYSTRRPIQNMPRIRPRNDITIATGTKMIKTRKQRGLNNRKKCPSFLFLVSLLSFLQNASSIPRTSNSFSSHRELRNFNITYYSKPKLNWMVNLEQEVIQGNAVVQSPFDEDFLYVTSYSGTLTVISAKTGKILDSVRPKPRALSKGSGEVENWALYSNSGISFGKTSSGENFLVYSIVDDPPEMSDFVLGPKTRVIAVSIPKHEILWDSPGLPGKHKGSPVVYQVNTSPCVLLTTNTRISKSDNTTIQTGHVSLIDATKGTILWDESEWSRTDTPKGYGPPGLAKNPLRGMYNGGETNSNDMVVWTSNDLDGRGDAGHTFAFQIPQYTQEVTDQMKGLESKVLKKVGWNAVSRPVLNANGTNMFVGVTGNALRGWIGNARFDQTADWSANLFNDKIDPKAAIPSPPILSRDESRLFVSSSSFDLAGINSLDGRSIWTVKGTSQFVSEPRVSLDDKRLYVVQSADGRIFCRDQKTGTLFWEASCDQFQEDCSNSVRADFDLSSTGQFLYFSDVKGRLISLKLGELEVLDPTAPPNWAGPLFPTNGVDWDRDTDKEETKRNPSIGGTVTLIVLAFMIAFGSTAYIFMVQRRKKSLYGREEPYPDLGDFAFPNDPDGPDPYEDSMIIQHTPKSGIIGGGYSGREDFYSPAYFTPDDSVSVNSYAPADRISLVMGTSNRIAPLKEDFSYGASVLV